MKNPHDIIIRPIITEKKYGGYGRKNIPLRLTKGQIRLKSRMLLKRYLM